MPDNSNLNLYHNQFLPVEVYPLTKPQEKVKLDYIILSPKIKPGTPIPITYKWSGSWQKLQSGLVLLTYRQENINKTEFPELISDNNVLEKPVTKFIHDHGIGMGSLHPGMLQGNESEVGLEIIERIGMLPPSNIIPGTYMLEATYLNRETGESYPITVEPPVRVQVDPQAEVLPAPELDLVTQLRMWGQKLPQGIKGLETIFAEVARVNQYDPVQDYTEQGEQTLAYRLQREPDNLELLYGLALAQVLQKDAEGAIATLTRVTQLDSQNPFAYAYLAFLYLYNLNPGAAKIALKSALEIDPHQPEIRSLNGIAALMQGNLVQAWQELKVGQ